MNVKKILAIGLSTCLVMSMAACSNTDKPKETGSNSEVVETPTTSEDVEVNKSVIKNVAYGWQLKVPEALMDGCDINSADPASIVFNVKGTDAEVMRVETKAIEPSSTVDEETTTDEENNKPEIAYSDTETNSDSAIDDGTATDNTITDGNAIDGDTAVSSSVEDVPTETAEKNTTASDTEYTLETSSVSSSLVVDDSTNENQSIDETSGFDFMNQNVLGICGDDVVYEVTLIFTPEVPSDYTGDSEVYQNLIFEAMNITAGEFASDKLTIDFDSLDTLSKVIVNSRDVFDNNNYSSFWVNGDANSDQIMQGFGFDTSLLAEYSASASLLNVKAYSVMVLKPTSDDVSSKVLCQAQSYVSGVKQSFEGYLPDQLAIASAATVENYKGYVIVVMCENSDDVASSIKQQIDTLGLTSADMEVGAETSTGTGTNTEG